MSCLNLVSVPSFGDSFFILNRPTINNEDINVSVPSFGDSFFIALIKRFRSFSSGFRPLIRGFFFYFNVTDSVTPFSSVTVSVPSFGDSFFIAVGTLGKDTMLPFWFPSPHSGILFL